MTVKTENYCLKEDLEIGFGSQDKKILPAGSYVKPVERKYLPKHIIEKEKKSYFPFDPELDVYCHTQYGFVAIARKNLRER